MNFPDPQLETMTVFSQRYMNNSRVLLLAQQYDTMRTLHLKNAFPFFYLFSIFWTSYMGEIVSLNYVVSPKENTCFSFKPIHCIGFFTVYHLTQTKVDINLWVAESSYCFL